MDEGEIDLLEHGVFSTTSMLDEFSKNSSSMESFLDDLLKNTHTCTHTHTCNPPGPDSTHTHTCFHTHTKLLADIEEEKSVDNSETHQNGSSKSKKRTSGNREAVRKYREKKKAHTAYLEEEVSHLRALNQHLIKKLQAQAGLEAEVVRLRCLLADFRHRIDGELGAYPYQKPVGTDEQDGTLQLLPGGYVLNSFQVPCDADVPCLHPSITPQWNGGMLSEDGSTTKWQEGCNLVAGNCQALKVNEAGSCGVVACPEDTMANVVPAAVPSENLISHCSMTK